jgi:RNA polymerase sigma factor (sigma-70 family)
MRRENFERLYAEHAQPLFGFLLYRTGDRGLSEDLLGDTFERVLHSRRRFDPRKGSEKTWLYSIALNALRDHARRVDAEQRALAQVEPSGSGAADGMSAVDLVHERDALARALATLSEEEREAIALRYGAELTVPEMARALGEKLTTVDGRVYRALRKLRAELD